jgi:lipid-binding SYLF domain-containing protein
MTRLIILATLTAAMANNAFPAAQEMTADKRIQHAANALAEIIATNENGIPRNLINKAQCIVIVPGLVKGAFLFGGKRGRGFASCRKPRGGWTAPAAVAIEGGSFGPQLGASSTDLIMLVMNKNGMTHLLSDKFTLGADIAVVQGMTGRDASANMDATGRAAILTYSHAKGLFTGISLEGATLRTDSGENKKLYGQPMNNKQILDTTGKGVPAPPATKPLMAALIKLAPRAKKA